MASGNLVLIGASGWLHPAWRGSFYPDGLPDDWQLSYYNTQFQAVYLPAPVWQAASTATWDQWLHDTQDGSSLKRDGAGAARFRRYRWPRRRQAHAWWLDEV
jgi:hypothetical protein